MKTRQAITDTTTTTVSVLALVMLAIVQSGCSSPTAGPEPPSGGARYVLDYSVFATQIDSILTAKGCDNLACHGGGIRGTFELSPVTAKDIDLDFDQASLQVNPTDPSASALLVKPLDEAAGGAIHTGGARFMSTSDPDYQAIFTWIKAGQYE
jgi:hypothetical protein